MLDYTQSFQDFAAKVKPTDLAIYAGAGLVLWVLFKDKLSPVQNLLTSLVGKIKSSVPQKSNNNSQDLFFQLVSSWKQTRDLAIKNGCPEAVRVADEMFPFLSPNVCNKEESK